jgi:hypothetical protein
MNLSLIDPFAIAQDYPDSLTGTLRMLISPLSASDLLELEADYHFSS